MTLIRLISDTHLKPVASLEEQSTSVRDVFRQFEETQEHNVTLVLAGDIGDSYSEIYRRFLMSARKAYSNVLLVPGNHEYYTDGKKDMHVVQEHLERLCRETGVTLLDNNSVVLNGIRFVGSTCWPIIPETLFKALRRAKYGLVARITRNSHKLDYADYKKLHDADVDYIQRTLNESKEPCVVVTHYPPSNVVVDDRFEDDPYLTINYNSGLIDKVPRMLLWCCGHVHTSKKFWVKGMRTLLATNCLAGGNYDKNLIFDVKALL
jgi:Icc-related predicted phosphoesterase